MPANFKAIRIVLPLLLAAVAAPACLQAQPRVAVKPRIIISSDIGGTDPDDNQSMIHFLMYSNMFRTEGLISSPSYGQGSKQNILEMIALYEKDFPKLRQHGKGYPSPASLRSICKQGRHGSAPYAGYSAATEGSDWIVKCARRKSAQPLWVLVWGGLEDVAQALHDAPDIENRIRVYWIGGPNKKWSVNSYAYIVKNFPDLWFIEDNSSYRGFFSDHDAPDSLTDAGYYHTYIREAGHMGKAFKNYYKGAVKMGDTPSLLYMLNGNPSDPTGESWGGSFHKISHSSRTVYHRNTTLADTVNVYSVVEFHFKGPVIRAGRDSACFTMAAETGGSTQKWPGFYLGMGAYAIRYSPKQPGTLAYKITSAIPGFSGQSGQLAIRNIWPGHSRSTDYLTGRHWYSDREDPKLFDGKWQGAETVQKWRNEALLDWAKRWAWLR